MASFQSTCHLPASRVGANATQRPAAPSTHLLEHPRPLHPLGLKPLSDILTNLRSQSNDGIYGQACQPVHLPSLQSRLDRGLELVNTKPMVSATTAATISPPTIDENYDLQQQQYRPHQQLVQMQQQQQQEQQLPKSAWPEPSAPPKQQYRQNKPRNAKQCIIASCQSYARSRGLCKAHGGGKRCRKQGCNLSDQGGGFCIRHGGGKRCQVPGCMKSAQARHFCKTHGGGHICKADGCERVSQGRGYCRTHGGGPVRKKAFEVDSTATKTRTLPSDQRHQIPQQVRVVPTAPLSSVDQIAGQSGGNLAIADTVVRLVPSNLPPTGDVLSEPTSRPPVSVAMSFVPASSTSTCYEIVTSNGELRCVINEQNSMTPPQGKPRYFRYDPYKSPDGTMSSLDSRCSGSGPLPNVESDPVHHSAMSSSSSSMDPAYLLLGINGHHQLNGNAGAGDLVSMRSERTAPLLWHHHQQQQPPQSIAYASDRIMPLTPVRDRLTALEATCRTASAAQQSVGPGYEPWSKCRVDGCHNHSINETSLCMEHQSTLSVASFLLDMQAHSQSSER